MNLEAIVEYTYGRGYRFLGLPCGADGNYIMDGNLMITAMNKMVGRGDWSLFLFISAEKFLIETKSEAALDLKVFIPCLMQPDRFFALMSEFCEQLS